MNHLPNLLASGSRLINSSAGVQPKPTLEPLCSKYSLPVTKELPSLLNIKTLGQNVTAQAFYIQDFFTIQNECLDKKVLFEDKEFPPINTSLTSSQVLSRPIEWKRPHEIVDKPQFISSSWNRSFIEQGELGARWILGAVSNMAANPFLFAIAVSEDQSFTEKYAGIFHFRFWQYGKWLDVVVDDRLPTCNGKMMYMHAPDNQEFWSALLEKAYAKLYGSYEALNDMTVCEALEDFTGGIIELYNFQLNMDTSMMCDILLESFQRCSIIVCSKEVALVSVTPKGIKTGLCYGVTKLVEIDRNNSNEGVKTLMVRLRYPFGVKDHWTGAFSELSPEWHSISPKDLDALHYTNRGEEFWLPFDEVIANFDKVEICHLHPNSVSLSAVDISLGKLKWDVSFLEGSWTLGETSGGCRNLLGSFIKNQQFFITINNTSSDSNYSVIIGLTQKFRHSYKGNQCHHIGYVVYRLPDDAAVKEPLNAEFIATNQSVARSPSFVDIKEITNRFTLPAGRYCIIPSTFSPDEEAEFVLRVFSASKLTDCSKKRYITKLGESSELTETTTLITPAKTPIQYSQGVNSNGPDVNADLLNLVAVNAILDAVSPAPLPYHNADCCCCDCGDCDCGDCDCDCGDCDCGDCDCGNCDCDCGDCVIM